MPCGGRDDACKRLAHCAAIVPTDKRNCEHLAYLVSLCIRNKTGHQYENVNGGEKGCFLISSVLSMCAARGHASLA